jgi:hypothetical protein
MAKAIRYYNQGVTFFDGNKIASGYQLFQYQAGTSTKANTYTDATQATANANPMTLNASGRLDQDVYITQAMKFVLAPAAAGDPPSSSVWTVDNVVAVDQLWTTSLKTANYTTVASDRDTLIKVDATSGNITISLLASATAGNGFMEAVKKIDSSSNTVTIAANGSEKIDGQSSITLSAQYNVIVIENDGTGWNIINSAATSSATFSANDSTNSGVTDLAIFQHTTSGTQAIGIGTGILFKGASLGSSPTNFGEISFVASNVTGGSEATYAQIQTRTGGSALAVSYKFARTGTADQIFTTPATAERTFTLPDANLAFTYSGGQATFAGTLTATRTYTLPDASFTVMAPAAYADMVAGTSGILAVSPLFAQNHPSACKVWATVNVSGGVSSLAQSYGVSSITHTSAGNITVTFSTVFTSANYCAVAAASTGAGSGNCANVKTGQLVGSMIVRTFVASTGADTDNINFTVATFGTQ